MGKLLEVKDLKKYFNTPSGRLHAVDGVSFSIESGKTLGVVGESGCGKSTLGRTVIRLLDPTSGQIYFDGQEITAHTKEKNIRTQMQMIFQDPFSSLNPRMTVSQIIQEPLLIHKLCPKNQLESRLKELMDTVGLASRFADAYPHEMDGGRRQRIGIARALALNPKFIVCDEPVSALDVSIQAQILNLLMDLQDSFKYTYMFITHDLSVVKHISHNIMVMYLGMAVEVSETDELFERPLHPYTKALFAAIPVPDLHHKNKMIPLTGEITSPIDPEPGCRFAARCPYATEQCRKDTPQLREILPGHFVACHRVEEINKKEEVLG